MKSLVWNCCGLGIPQAILAICFLLRQEVPGLLCLIETKSVAHEINSIKWRLGFSNALCVDCVDRRGGLVVFWNCGVNISIKQYIENFMDMEVEEEREVDRWRFTLF